MGNNSNEIKGTDHTRIDSEPTETDPTLECTTHEGMPFSVEQKALAVILRRLPPAVIRKARKSGMMSTVSGSSLQSAVPMLF